MGENHGRENGGQCMTSGIIILKVASLMHWYFSLVLHSNPISHSKQHAIYTCLPSTTWLWILVGTCVVVISQRCVCGKYYQDVFCKDLFQEDEKFVCGMACGK